MHDNIDRYNLDSLRLQNAPSHLDRLQVSARQAMALDSYAHLPIIGAAMVMEHRVHIENADLYSAKMWAGAKRRYRTFFERAFTSGLGGEYTKAEEDFREAKARCERASLFNIGWSRLIGTDCADFISMQFLGSWKSGFRKAPDFVYSGIYRRCGGEKERYGKPHSSPVIMERIQTALNRVNQVHVPETNRAYGRFQTLENWRQSAKSLSQTAQAL